jgi:hypothetical protein
MNQVEFIRLQLEEEGFYKTLELDEQEAVEIMLSRYVNEDWWDHSPHELAKVTRSSVYLWERLLGTSPIRQYIGRRQKEFVVESHRKGLRALAKEAAGGNVQANKELKELTGLFNSEESRTIVILHRISRPEDELEV